MSITRAELLALIRDDRGALDEIVAPLSDAALASMAPGAYVRAPLDTINAQLYRLHRHDVVTAVRVEFAAAHAAIVAFIETLTEPQLSEVYWKDDPSGRTVREKISGDTYLHYREHAAWIREIVEREAV